MGKRKKTNPVLKILGVLFVIFMALYIASTSGYYESKIRDKVVVTEEGIKEFESKVQNGEDIDITSFLNTKRPDYSSPISKLGDNVTRTFQNVVFEGSKFLADILKSLF